MAAAGLRVDGRIEMRVEDGRVVIEPVREADLAFDAELYQTLGEWASAEDDAAWAGL